MSLLDKAKAKAKEKADKKAAEAQAKEEESKRLHKALKPLAKKAMEALQPLDGAKCKGGKFRLLTGSEAWFCGTQYLAILDRVDSRYKDRVEHIVFIKAAVESGTTDMSDDVRDVPWTSPMVTFASQVQCYAYNEANPYFRTSATNEADLEKALDELANHLTHYINEPT